MREPVPEPFQSAGDPPGRGADAGVSPPSRGRPGLLDAIGSLAGFLVLSVVVGTALLTLLGRDDHVSGVDRATSGLVATPLAWLALAGWAIWVSQRRGHGIVVDYDWAFRWRDAAVGLLFALVVFLAASVFVVVYHQLTGGTPNSSVGTAAQNSGAAWQVVGLALMALGAAFVEEIHFRGLWWHALRRHGLHPAWVLVITSALFALFHFELERAPLLFVTGLAAGAARMVTGRLGAAIATHLLVNLVGSLGLLSMLGQ